MHTYLEIFKKVHQKLLLIFGLMPYFSNNPYGTLCMTTLLTDDADKLYNEQQVLITQSLKQCKNST